MHLKHVRAATWMSGALALLLAGCGGGGGGSAPETSRSGAVAVDSTGEAQGLYSGTYPRSDSLKGQFATLILENDETWTLHGVNTDQGQFFVEGLVQGQGHSARGRFTSSDLRDYTPNELPAAASLQATYDVGKSFSGTVSYASGRQVAFAGLQSADAATSYSKPARLEDITGDWVLTELSGATTRITIQGDGALSGNVDGCGYSGTIVPRPTGKNVFNLSMTYGNAAGCDRLAGLSGRGIALSYPLASGKHQFVAGIVSADRTRAAVAFGVR